MNKRKHGLAGTMNVSVATLQQLVGDEREGLGLGALSSLAIEIGLLAHYCELAEGTDEAAMAAKQANDVLLQMRARAVEAGHLEREVGGGDQRPATIAALDALATELGMLAQYCAMAGETGTGEVSLALDNTSKLLREMQARANQVAEVVAGERASGVFAKAAGKVSSNETS